MKRFESLSFQGRYVSQYAFDSKPGTFDEDLQLAQDVIGEALEDLPAAQAVAIKRGLDDIGLIAEARRISHPEAPRTPATVSKPQALAEPAGRRVFLVHGKDEELKQTVARFLEKLKLDPIILHEQANQGRTLIEKFEAHSDVGFAVVLLTPDDVGHPVGDPAKAAPRARQNVVFELGYFFGRIGRGKVCAMYRAGVEMPTDVHGVAYVPVDDLQAWMTLLAREIKAAGVDIDLNLLV